MAIKKEIIDDLLKGRDPKTVLSSDGLLGELKKILADRILNAEMDEHLSEPKQAEVSEAQKPGNHRNGYSKKTVLTDNESLELSIPRDRHREMEGRYDRSRLATIARPPLLSPHSRSLRGFISSPWVCSVTIAPTRKNNDRAPIARPIPGTV